MRKYELTIVVAGKTTSAKRKATVEKIEKMVDVFEGKVDKKEDWGEIELATKIKKQENGLFLHFILELNSDTVGKVEEKLKQEENVLRHLLVKKED